MSKVKRRLIEELSQRTGMDCAHVVDELYAKGTLDDCLARQYVVKTEFTTRIVTSDKSELQICQELADDYGFSWQRVYQLIRNVKNTYAVAR